MISAAQVSGEGSSIAGGTGSSSPLRGRDEQLDMVTGFLEHVRTGAGGVTIIEGAAGLGKTRLLAAARATARTLSFRTGLGAAEPGHSSVELAVLIEALFGGAESLIERNALGSRDGSREEPFWLLQDVQTLMERAALRQPLLVCLDDVQWADGGTAAALRALPPRLASLPIGWVIAMRPDQGSWQISDVYLDGTISQLAVHRSEFYSILRREGVDGLVMALNRKTDLLQSVARSS